MKILIIEDEPRAASQLESTLKACNFQYQLLEIIDTVEDGIKWFQQHSAPDLVFVDIQLADGLSFEIFQQVTVEVTYYFYDSFRSVCYSGLQSKQYRLFAETNTRERLRFGITKI